MKNIRLKILGLMLTLCCFSTLAIGLLTTNSVTTVTLKDYYIKIERVQIVDMFASGTYTLSFGVNWQRIFNQYGDAFQNNDNQYENGLRSWDSHPSTWVTYGQSIPCGTLITFEDDAYTETGFTIPIEGQGSEIILFLRMKKITTKYAYEPVQLTTTFTYTWSSIFYFPDWGGCIRIYYMVCFPI